MNPGVSDATTVVFLQLFTRVTASSRTSAPVARPGTISTSGISAAGLKKWIPTTRSACAHPPAIAVTLNDDVFVGTFGSSRSRPGTLRIYRNQPGIGFEEWWQGQVPGNGYTGSVADMNGDGAPDLIVGEKNSIRILLNQTGWPRISRLERVATGMALLWTSAPGKVYRVQFKNRLSEPEWTDLNGDVTSTTTSATKIDEAGGASAERFYRVLALP